MAGETHKIDWVADISIETDYIVGVHDSCDCMRVGNGAEWLFEFWFGSEILTSNVSIEPYAKKPWVIDEINKIVAIVNDETRIQVNDLREYLDTNISDITSNIDGLSSRVSKNGSDISDLLSKHDDLYDRLEKLELDYTNDIKDLIKADSDINKRIDDLELLIGDGVGGECGCDYESRFVSIEGRLDNIEDRLENWTPDTGGDGDGDSEEGVPGDSSKYIKKNVADSTTGMVTFKNGIAISNADGSKTINITIRDNALMIDGNAFTSGWFAAGGYASSGGSGPSGQGNVSSDGELNANALLIGAGGKKISASQYGIFTGTDLSEAGDYTIPNTKAIKAFVAANKNQNDLPIASSTTLGCVKIGSGLAMNGDVLYATGGSGGSGGSGDVIAYGNLEDGEILIGGGSVYAQSSGYTIDNDVSNDSSKIPTSWAVKNYVDSKLSGTPASSDYLRKDTEDTALKMITFVDGIRIGNSSSGIDITWDSVNQALFIGGSAYTSGWLAAGA